MLRWDRTKNQKHLKFARPMMWSAPSCRENCSVIKPVLRVDNVTNVVESMDVAIVHEPMDVDSEEEENEDPVVESSEEESSE